MKIQASTLYQASSSSSPSRSWRYHVFLSFRGKDTRKGFTDHLLAALERKGITTFIDEKDIEKGEHISTVLLKAIKESMFAIIILSPNYASSTWCLDELQMIVDCKNSLGLTVMPVFYGVHPSDARHQRGSFGEAFRKHEENFQGDKGKVERWKDALRQAATYSGWDSKDWYEAALVESIAQHISKQLIPKLSSFTENLVGTASRVEEVNKLMGMGLNETIKGEFDVAFLPMPTLESYLRQMVWFTDKKNFFLICIQVGVIFIICMMGNRQYETLSLAENKEWFGPGSGIIITTRDRHLRRIGSVHGIYEVGSLVQMKLLKRTLILLVVACCCWSLLVVVTLILVVVYLVFAG